MLSNLKLAWRALKKHKLYSVINILGLGVGIAAALLIYYIVSFELSYNKTFKNYERIVRICREDFTPEEGTNLTTGVPIPAMGQIVNDYPQFEAACRYREIWSDLAVPDEHGGPHLKKFYMGENAYAVFTEPAFFKIFKWPWLAGDPQGLERPNTIVLNKRMAEKCFEQWSTAIGKTLMLDNLIRVEVIGVVDNALPNTDFQIEYWVSWPTFKANADSYFYDETWGSTSSNNQVWALLQPGMSFEAANQAIAAVGKTEYVADNNRGTKKHYLQPFEDVHYNEDLGTGIGYTINKKRILVLALIGLLIVVMACFNFINLSTALATERAKEIGIRKTLGSNRQQLIHYFLMETLLVVIMAVGLGVIIAFLATPALGYISAINSGSSIFNDPTLWIFLIGLAMGMALLSGIYPALVLSSFQPVKIFKEIIPQKSRRGFSLRKGLVVGQFIIAQGLILGTVITMSQLAFIRKMDLGFKHEDLVYTFSANYDSTSLSGLPALKQELLSLPMVEAVSFSSDLPASGNTWSSNFALGRGKDDAPFDISLKFCDQDYQQVYGLTMLSGRWFSDNRDSVTEGVLNFTTLKRLGITNTDSVLGSDLRLGGSRFVRIVGVCADFHSHSIHDPLEPILMSPSKKFFYYTGVKIKPEQASSAITAIKKGFDKVNPNITYEGRFFDERIAAFYRAENRFAAFCKGFALLAIILSCLGLFGLASFTVGKRVKEIGIRKVLGCTAEGIVNMIARDFLQLVLVAFFVAMPLTIWLMTKWLDNFVYRINISWWMVASTGVIILLVTFFTVSYHSLKAALTNPVESLRNE